MRKYEPLVSCIKLERDFFLNTQFTQGLFDCFVKLLFKIELPPVEPVKIIVFKINDLIALWFQEAYQPPFYN